MLKHSNHCLMHKGPHWYPNAKLIYYIYIFFIVKLYYTVLKNHENSTSKISFKGPVTCITKFIRNIFHKFIVYNQLKFLYSGMVLSKKRKLRNTRYLSLYLFLHVQYCCNKSCYIRKTVEAVFNQQVCHATPA